MNCVQCEAMIDGFSLLTLAHVPPSYKSCSLREATLKRKSVCWRDQAWKAASGYPSPPMSSPPSPKRRQSDLTLPSTQPSTRSQQFVTTSAAQPTISTASYPSEETPLSFATSEVSRPRFLPNQAPAPFVPGHGHSSAVSTVPAYPPTSSYAPTTSSSGRLISQEGRKAKTHVASACVNCKRAHLSCDVQRPCAHCITSGKQVRATSLISPASS